MKKEEKSSAEVQLEFTSKLRALIAEYNADVYIEDIGTAYMSKEVIEVYIPTVWDGDRIISDSASFNLGDRI